MHQLGGCFPAGVGVSTSDAYGLLFSRGRRSSCQWACRPAEAFVPAVEDTAGPQTPLVEETDSSATGAVSAPGSPLDDEGGDRSSIRDVGRQASA